MGYPRDGPTSASPSCQPHQVPSCLFCWKAENVKHQGREKEYVKSIWVWKICMLKKQLFKKWFPVFVSLSRVRVGWDVWRLQPGQFTFSSQKVCRSIAQRLILNTFVSIGSSHGFLNLGSAKVKKRKALRKLFPTDKGKYYCHLHSAALSLHWEYWEVGPALKTLAELRLLSLTGRLRGIQLLLNMMWG